MFRAPRSVLWAALAAAVTFLPATAGAADDNWWGGGGWGHEDGCDHDDDCDHDDCDDHDDCGGGWNHEDDCHHDNDCHHGDCDDNDGCSGGGDDDCGCGCGSGCELLMPEFVPVGEYWTTTIKAMPDSLAFLLIAGDDGPLPSKYGPLSIGAPILAIYVIDTGPTGCVTFDHLAHCDPQWVGVTAYFQFVALTKSLPQQACVSNAATLTVTPGDCVDKGDFCTVTQGGWGSKCKGNNFGCLRDQWFGTAFPAGLLIGDQGGPNDGDNHRAALFTSSYAVKEFLPAGGTAKKLDKDEVNPDWTSAGVFAGQLVAATINVRFDEVGAFDDKKDNLDVALGDLHFLKGVDDKLVGLTVNEVIELSNQVISGQLSTPVDVDNDGHGDVWTSDLSDALSRFNECFDEGATDQGWLGF